MISTAAKTSHTSDTNMYLDALIKSSASKHGEQPTNAYRNSHFTFIYAARLIRIITVPPVIVSILLAALYLNGIDIFRDRADFIMSLIFFGMIPLSSYPISYIIPSVRKKARDGQRSLAFIFTISGYIFAVIYGILLRVSDGLMFIYLTYLMSAVLLVVFNRLFHIKASGHACSTVGPLTLMVYYLGISVLPAAIITALLTAWASVKLKRHTISDLMWGAFVCLPGSLTAYMLVYIL